MSECSVGVVCVCVCVGGGGVVQSNSPRPPRRQHRGGTPIPAAGRPSGRLQQRGDAAGGREGRMLHRGGSDGISCARDGRQQVPFSACGLLDEV